MVLATLRACAAPRLGGASGWGGGWRRYARRPYRRHRRTCCAPPTRGGCSGPTRCAGSPSSPGGRLVASRSAGGRCRCGSTGVGCCGRAAWSPRPWSGSVSDWRSGPTTAARSACRRASRSGSGPAGCRGNSGPGSVTGCSRWCRDRRGPAGKRWIWPLGLSTGVLLRRTLVRQWRTEIVGGTPGGAYRACVAFGAGRRGRLPAGRPAAGGRGLARRLARPARPGRAGDRLVRAWRPVRRAAAGGVAGRPGQAAAPAAVEFLLRLGSSRRLLRDAERGGLLRPSGNGYLWASAEIRGYLIGREQAVVAANTARIDDRKRRRALARERAPPVGKGTRRRPRPPPPGRARGCSACCRRPPADGCRSASASGSSAGSGSGSSPSRPRRHLDPGRRPSPARQLDRVRRRVRPARAAGPAGRPAALVAVADRPHVTAGESRRRRRHRVRGRADHAGARPGRGAARSGRGRHGRAPRRGRRRGRRLGRGARPPASAGLDPAARPPGSAAAAGRDRSGTRRWPGGSRTRWRRAWPA